MRIFMLKNKIFIILGWEYLRQKIAYNTWVGIST